MRPPSRVSRSVRCRPCAWRCGNALADDEAVEGCWILARRGQKVANRCEILLLRQMKLDIGTASPLAPRALVSAARSTSWGQRLATSCAGTLKSLQPAPAASGNDRFEHLKSKRSCSATVPDRRCRGGSSSPAQRLPSVFSIPSISVQEAGRSPGLSPRMFCHRCAAGAMLSISSTVR